METIVSYMDTLYPYIYNEVDIPLGASCICKYTTDTWYAHVYYVIHGYNISMGVANLLDICLTFHDIIILQNILWTICVYYVINEHVTWPYCVSLDCKGILSLTYGIIGITILIHPFINSCYKLTIALTSNDMFHVKMK